MDPNPIQRLAYHNGQRLEAADLRLEQNYHIAVRRLLTSGLFTPGVVSGFEVTVNPNDPTNTSVLVKSGVALDALGREIVQVADQTLAVLGTPPTTPLTGYFLTATYAEQSIQATDGWCAPADPGAAGLTQEGATLAWTESIPAPTQCTPDNPSDCGIVLAFVDLDSSCKVIAIILAPRQYAAPTHTSQTQAFALEGEKDIDQFNPKRLNFQIVGGPPQSIQLYLWGDQFSSLYYTELGVHDHTLNAGGRSVVTLDWANHTHSLNAHTHPLETSQVKLSDQRGSQAPQPLQTDPDGDHIHNLNVFDTSKSLIATAGGSAAMHKNENNYAVEHTAGGRVFVSRPTSPYAKNPNDPKDDSPGNVVGAHSHSLTQVIVTGLPVTTDTPTPNETLPGTPPSDSNAVTGLTDATGTLNAPDARTDDAYTYIDNLQVALGSQGHPGVDITGWILKQLPTVQSLGDGTGPFPAGPIDLLAVAANAQISLGPGSHYLDFSVAAGGGKVLYNLYVR